MFTITNYVAAESLEEAYTLLGKNRSNKIMGGTLWMRMGSQNIHTAIDLQKLGLDQITENETYIEIGAMCTLRALETNPLIQNNFDGLLAQCVKDIVGVQFRNCATIGGSVYSRFGFSDVLTALLALDSYVELYHEGIISLEEFINKPFKKDILVKILIKKDSVKGVYQTERLSRTDFPVLAVAVAYGAEGYKISVGARPSKATLAHEAMDYLNTLESKVLSEEMAQVAAKKVVDELHFASNMRGTKAFREHLASVLVARCLMSLNY